MSKILILVEKPSIEKVFRKAINNENVEIMSIGGRVYTKGETTIQVTEEELNTCPHFWIYNEEEGKLESAYILGSEIIQTNCKMIKEFLDNNDIGVIINACDYDKQGDFLFAYAINDCLSINRDDYEIRRMKCLDLRFDYIKVAYENTISN